MSGYLRRLALRTLRLSPTVHSVASFPYATWSRPERPVFDIQSAIGDSMAEDSQRISPQRNSEAPMSRPAGSVAGAVPDASIRPWAPLQSAPVDASAPLPGTRAAPVAARVAQDPCELDRDHWLPARESRAERAAPSAVPGERSTRAVEPPGRREEGAFDPDYATSAPKRRATEPLKSREPLPAPGRRDVSSPSGMPALSPAPVVTQPAFVPIGLGPRDRRARSASEAPEVHVSIGRIEVTAVHETPRPAPRAAKGYKPMTLAEYLAGRQGR